jgi:hypothetical protein
MVERRTAVISGRVRPSILEMARHAAAKQNRSISNYIERLVELDSGFVPSEAAAPYPTGYAFTGKVIRIDRQTFEDWLVQFPNLPSLEVALRHADAAIADNPPDNWFEPLVAWLSEQNGSGNEHTG